MIKKIKIKELRIGMFVHDFNCGWMDHPFIKRRLTINTDAALEKVLEAGHLLLQHRSASSSRLSLDFPDLPGKPAYTLKPGQPSPGQHSLLRPPFAVTPSTGILTCFPSTTPFGLALGVDSPCPD